MVLSRLFFQEVLTSTLVFFRECQKADWKNHKAKCTTVKKKAFIQL